MNKKPFIQYSEEALLSDKKAALFRCGKIVFSDKGFRNAKISDITERA